MDVRSCGYYEGALGDGGFWLCFPIMLRPRTPKAKGIRSSPNVPRTTSLVIGTISRLKEAQATGAH